MKTVFAVATAAVVLAAPAFAEGDAEKGEKAFKKCKACHTIVSPEGEVVFKGGKTGPNLYGVVGAVAGSQDFKYGDGLVAANEAGFVWTEGSLAAYTASAKDWLKDNDFPAKTKMTFKLKKGGEDVAAYLASVAPAPAAEEGEAEATSD
ncbi:cytochrome c [Shimia gijangensis]|uniref:Cytochrome c n=1 Tax=Shimia gijangensis TaxID=1470563 RepID=A0A1M6G1V5_9RHOB|nr:c-type cytochrome [Shimia gijangensis]SHJ03842.1 cytochrome c [Shimia gijangensis]